MGLIGFLVLVYCLCESGMFAFAIVATLVFLLWRFFPHESGQEYVRRRSAEIRAKLHGKE